MALTIAQIIAEGLSQTGRTDLTSNGRLWLKLFLQKAYMNYDWVWLEKDPGASALTQNLAFFSDYRKLKSAVLLYNGYFLKELESVGGEQWLLVKRDATATGAPIYVYPDREASVFRFWPTPDLSYTWNPIYYKIPALPDHTSSSADSTSPTWGEAEEVLIRAIQLKSLYYKDDSRYDAEEKALFAEIIQSKMNSYDQRAGRNKLKMGKSFRRRF